MVWNIKCQEKRQLELIPNDDWPGAGLLGVTIRLDDYGGADERLIKVLEVEEHSPASIAGLVPMRDYLLGTTIVSFGSTDVLANTLNENYEEVSTYMHTPLGVTGSERVSLYVFGLNTTLGCRNLRLQFRI